MVATHYFTAAKTRTPATDPVTVYTPQNPPLVSYYDTWQLPPTTGRILLYLAFALIIIGLLINVRH